MCILFVALEVHPQYPLILCANRDEFHHRPTEPAHFWPPDKQLLAGKDLEAGGSWLGVNRQGEIAALTNIRAPELHEANRHSRGDLVIRALTQSQTMTTPWLMEHSQHYNPFNLLFGKDMDLYCYHSISKTVKPLSPGFHAISNGALDDIWPKMAKGTQALEQEIGRSGEIDIQALLTIMTDERQAPDEDLPQTGVALEWERLLSSIYIKHPEYGTRSTSILLRDRQGRCEFVEVRYDGKGRNLGRQVFKFETGPENEAATDNESPEFA
ncbi:NRDE family protein [Shewanella sp. Isolate8]|uniref:NRDE family protein n=1 Tax=Shewanella sp. Isolate8 TaxID=2908529 RepID=UPI001EFD27F0|nr:NRDE family protein [Shewanella sp. Isolate8]MCG9748754.1 NRDE family protein [Shewanella sp. Isolate8]